MFDRKMTEITAKLPKASPVKRASDSIKAVGKESHVSRRIEDWLALAGVGQAMLYGVAEFLIHIGVVKQSSGGIPYMTIALFIGCVLPKTVGRATAGKVWEAIAARFGKAA